MQKKSNSLEIIKIFFLAIICLLLLLIYTKDNKTSENPMGQKIFDNAVKQGMTVFEESARQANRDGLEADLYTILNIAKQSFEKKELKNFEVPGYVYKSGNGKFEITKKTENEIVVIGVGKEKGNDGINSIKLKQKLVDGKIEKVETIN